MRMVDQYCSKCGEYVRTVRSGYGVSWHYTCAVCRRRYLTEFQARLRGHKAPQDKPPTFTEIGKALGISRAVAFKTYVTAMEKLRTTVSRELVRELLAPLPEPHGAFPKAQQPLAVSELPLQKYPLIPQKKHRGFGL